MLVRICFAFMILCTAVLAAEDPTPTMAQSYPTRQSLRDYYDAREVTFEEIAASGVPAGIDLLVWQSHSTQLPASARTPAVVNAIKAWIENGGSLFLASFAHQYVLDLGLETIALDRADFYRHGLPSGSDYFDQGFKALIPDHPLFSGMTLSGDDANVYYIAGSYALSLETNCWEQSSPQNSTWLARYFRKRGTQLFDGTPHKTLNLWSMGDGKVLGYGQNLFLEDFWANRNRANLFRFLDNVETWMTGKASPVVGALPTTPARLDKDQYVAAPFHVPPQPHSLERQLPGLPYLAHWGWLGAIEYQRLPRQPVGMDYFKQRLIDEPAKWGANQIEFYPPSMSNGFPFAWGAGDPIPPPQGFWGGAFWPEWSWQRARELIAYAHDRDFIIHTFYHPDPVSVQSGESASDVYPRFVELQGRELQNSLLYGREACQDGIGLEVWYSDTAGDICERAWWYNPGSYIHSTSRLIARTPNFTGTWQCAWGRAAAVHASGFGNEFRYGFHPPLFLGDQADCRDSRTSDAAWGTWANFGGGSYPDWIIRQTHDFCRDRLYLDSGIWWLGEPEANLRPAFREYVYATCLDPIRAALTSRMYALGQDGFRARTQQTYSNVPVEWANAESYPQDTAFIQNNYLRILRFPDGDGGVLQYDPTRTAFFHETERPHPRVDLSPAFLTSRPLLSLPASSPAVALRIGTVNNSAAEFLGAGGYSSRYIANAEASQFPAEIHYEDTPDWPQEVEWNTPLQTGRHELVIHTLTNSGVSIVEVFLDDVLHTTYFPHPGQTQYVIPFSVVSAGAHELRLSVQRASGLAHRFDAVEIRRVGDLCSLQENTVIGGHRAVLTETIVYDASGEYRQMRRYEVDNDSPAFVVRLDTSSPEPTAWETRIALPGYDAPLPLSGAPNAWRMASSATDTPALILYAHGLDIDSVTRDGDEMVLGFASRTSACGDLSFVLDDGLYTEEQLAALAYVLFEPMLELSLEPETPHVVRNSIAAPRTRVIETTNASGPYLVCETGAGGAWWTARGGQPLGSSGYLKIYLGSNGEAQVQPYGFIRGIVKPGWGCQYMLGIRDTIQPRSCEVQVVKTGPFIFAPRIEWKAPFDTVRVNGEEWRYFEDNIVYLPNRPGRYSVEVSTTGNTAPHLARTFLDVSRAVWNTTAEALEVSARMPHWWDSPLPSNDPYTAIVLSASAPTEVEGGGRVRDWSEYRVAQADKAQMAARGSVVELYPGAARIQFGSVEGSVMQVPKLTQPVRSHWYGYYDDKWQFDPAGRYLLGNEVDFDFRNPTASDVITLGVIDLEAGGEWIPFATTAAWCWQQGSMLQWVPDATRTVIYNDQEGDHFVSRIGDPFTGEFRTIDAPVYTISSDGTWALGINFARIDDTREGYGYEGLPDPFYNDNHPAADGVYSIDLITGASHLIVSLDTVANFERTPETGEGKHWFTVCEISPSGTRIAIMQRWYKAGGSGYTTRLLTANPDGSDLFVMDPYGSTSHYNWRDDTHLICWTYTPMLGSAYTLFTDKSRDAERIGAGILTTNGHMTYSPDNEWLVTDTYPDGDRMQTVMLFRPRDNRLVVLGKFHSPTSFSGPYRCDTHPRWSQDGRKICFDSGHSGRRQMYVIDVGWIVDSE